MKNLIRGHIYQLRRDYFFYGCLRFLYKGIIINHNKNRANLH